MIIGDITIVGAAAVNAMRATDRKNRQAILKNCTPFTNCITEIKNTQVNNEKDLDVVMPKYNWILIE